MADQEQAKEQAQILAQYDGEKTHIWTIGSRLCLTG